MPRFGAGGLCIDAVRKLPSLRELALLSELGPTGCATRRLHNPNLRTCRCRTS